MRATAAGRAESAHPHPELTPGIDALAQATCALLTGTRDAALANAFNYLMLCGTVIGGWYTARIAVTAQAALAAGIDEADFYQARLACARFYAAQVLPKAQGYAGMIAAGDAAVTAVDTARHL
jgi:hypothetical protein